VDRDRRPQVVQLGRVDVGQFCDLEGLEDLERGQSGGAGAREGSSRPVPVRPGSRRRAATTRCRADQDRTQDRAPRRQKPLRPPHHPFGNPRPHASPGARPMICSPRHCRSAARRCGARPTHPARDRRVTRRDRRYAFDLGATRARRVQEMCHPKSLPDRGHAPSNPRRPDPNLGSGRDETRHTLCHPDLCRDTGRRPPGGPPRPPAHAASPDPRTR
jgi:hypothetical protein